MANKEFTDRITLLTEKKLDGNILPAEEAELEAFLSSDTRLRKQFEMRTRAELLEAQMEVFIRAEAEWKEIMVKKLKSLLEEPNKVKRLYSRWQFYAAAVLVLFIVGIALLVRSDHSIKDNVPVVIAQDLKPGGNLATLILSNGQRIRLDSTYEGKLAIEGSTRVSKVGGALHYTTTKSEKPQKGNLSYNELSTPNAGMYMIVLPDRSKVWLNCASSLKYPTSFEDQTKRVIELKGEAFIEVAADPARPFQVLTNGTTTEVLGTSFNIKAYPDEPTVNTTLVTGVVKVANGAHTIILKPGQEARVNEKSLQVIPNADVESVTAWRNGYFAFNGANFDEVMQEIARWYDVEVVYQGAKPTERLTAMVSRKSNASTVLKALELSGYHFKIEGKRIIVKP